MHLYNIDMPHWYQIIFVPAVYELYLLKPASLSTAAASECREYSLPT